MIFYLYSFHSMNYPYPENFGFTDLLLPSVTSYEKSEDPIDI